MIIIISLINNSIQMSPKICLVLAALTCVSVGQVFAQDIMSDEIMLNSA